MLIVANCLSFDEPALTAFSAGRPVLNASLTRLHRRIAAAPWVLDEYSATRHLAAIDATESEQDSTVSDPSSRAEVVIFDLGEVLVTPPDLYEALGCAVVIDQPRTLESEYWAHRNDYDRGGSSGRPASRRRS